MRQERRNTPEPRDEESEPVSQRFLNITSIHVGQPTICISMPYLVTKTLSPKVNAPIIARTSATGIGLAGAELSFGRATKAFGMAALTTTTGFCVAGAHPITYRGGIFECEAAKSDTRRSVVFHPFKPTAIP